MRIVALSDQHGLLPEVPPCDLLIIAGDVCPDRIGPYLARDAPEQQQAWFDRNIRPWLATAPATHKILTWGNHDWCGQECSFDRDSPRNAPLRHLQILVDESTNVCLHSGAGGMLSVWATPWSNPFMDWAFMKTSRELADVYRSIPIGIDILVSHQPPYGYGDCAAGAGAQGGDHLGSRELLVAIDRVRPKAVICGHIHGGYGRYDHKGIPIFNVSVVDEQYRPTHPPTVIETNGRRSG